MNVPPGPGQGPPTNPWDQPSAPVDAGTMEVTATASADSSVEGSGTPQFTVAPYASDPIATNNTEASFFDLYVPPGALESSIQLNVCPTSQQSEQGQSLQWWNPDDQEYESVPSATLDTTVGSPTYDCFLATIDGSSTPSLAQLYGTVFGVGPLLTWDPPRLQHRSPLWCQPSSSRRSWVLASS